MMKRLKDYIYEMLSSLNTSKMIERIQDIYPAEHIKSIEIVDGSSKELKCVQIIFHKKRYFFLRESRLVKLLKTFNYIVTSYTDSDEGYIVYIDPEYSDSVSSVVYEDFKGIIYHLCKTEDVNKILNSGIRVKSPNNYRKYSPKAFYIGGSNESEVKDSIRYLVEDMWQYDKTERTVLKIDLNKHKDIPFYADTAAGNEVNLCFYTRVSIPKDYITVDKKLTKFANDLLT